MTLTPEQLDARTDLATLGREAKELSEEMSVDEVLAFRERVSLAAARLREIRDDLEAGLIRYMQANGDIEIGDGKRLYVGIASTTKVRDKAEALRAIVEACGGDIETLASYLGSQPIKHGAAKKLLGNDWDKHFIVEQKERAATGAAKLKVMEHDPRFT